MFANVMFIQKTHLEEQTMGNKEFLKLAVKTVKDYFNNRSEKTDKFILTEDDIYVVWYCKTLQNHKALLSTNVSDGMYYELTFNGDKKELYLDALRLILK